MTLYGGYLPDTNREAVRTSWDADRYADSLTPKQTGQNPKLEDRLSRAYPADHPGMYLNEPCVVVDIHGVILYWYLPDSLSTTRQVGVSTSYIYKFSSFLAYHYPGHSRTKRAHATHDGKA